jgi:hypothetical protein
MQDFSWFYFLAVLRAKLPLRVSGNAWKNRFKKWRELQLLFNRHCLHESSKMRDWDFHLKSMG